MPTFVRPTFLTLALILVSSCGGDGGSTPQPTPTPTPTPEPEVLTGVFIDSTVQGLTYATDTQSGSTNADGEFEYLEGETVTFSIGGIEIGSAVGAAEITPFSLFTLPPLTDPLEIGRVFYDDEITDQDRVFNIAMLLVALDANGDPEDGIDLADWNDILTSAFLSFDYPAREFADEILIDLAYAYDIPGADYETALNHLYSSLDVLVTTYKVLTKLDESDSDGDGVVDRRSTYTYTYDEAGNVITYETGSDTNADGTPENQDTTTYTYDGNGNLLTKVDGSSTTTNTYDAMGNLLTSIAEHSSYRESTIYTYDERGNRQSMHYELDWDPDENGTPNSKTVLSITYNEYGQTLTELRTVEQDANEDGIIDNGYSNSSTYTYDENGNLMTIVSGNGNTQSFSYDNNGYLVTVEEGPIDVNGDEIEDFITTTNSFDDNGNLLTSLTQTDLGGDGTIDATSSISKTYDENSNLLTELYETDEDADGTADSSQLKIYTYDDNGNQLTERVEDDQNGDGNPGIYANTYTYDDNGNRLSHLFEEGINEVGVPLYGILTTYTYDENDNQHTQLSEVDNDGDGTMDQPFESYTATFDEFGNRLTLQETEYFEGEIHSTRLIETSYQVFEHKLSFGN